MSNYKYKIQLDKIIAEGYPLPTLVEPNNKLAHRFVFANYPEKNHLPVCVSNPKRILPGPLKTSGYALSCFGDKNKAIQRYKALCSAFKRVAIAIGDSIAAGNLSNDDGRITEEENITSHFDFYEFEDCDLSRKFTIKQKLL